jgi:hypothetical protein
MSIVIACPVCTQKVRVPETVLGRQIKCPQCKNGFLAQDPNAIPPAPVFDEAFAAAPEAAPQSGESAGMNEFEDELTVPRPPSGFVDYLLFRRMVTPVIIVIFFYLGVLMLMLGALFGLVSGIVGISQRSYQLGALSILGAIFGTIVALILWRIFCEVLITLFRILDNVREINERQHDKV